MSSLHNTPVMDGLLFGLLPAEILAHIAEWLPGSALLQFTASNQTLRKACHTPLQWQRLCLNLNAVASGLAGVTVGQWLKHYRLLRELPTCLNRECHGRQGIANFIGNQALTVTSLIDHAICVQANRPLVPDGASIFYFEVHLDRLDEASTVSVGFAPPGFPPVFYQLETSRSTYALSGGSAAHTPHNSLIGHSASQQHHWVEGEVIGCGIRGFEGRSVFFTQNGRLVGDVYRLPAHIGPICPSIGMSRALQSVTVNFGNLPFRFDLAELLGTPDIGP